MLKKGGGAHPPLNPLQGGEQVKLKKNHAA